MRGFTLLALATLLLTQGCAVVAVGRVERVTDKATRVVVDASKKYVIKDAATATEILIQTTNNLPKKS